MAYLILIEVIIVLTVFTIAPNWMSILFGIVGFFTVYVSKINEKFLKFEKKLKFPLIRITFFFFELVFVVFLLSDCDSDNVANHFELKNDLNYTIADIDNDAMKDGVEFFQKDASLYNPKNADINSDDIADICNAIIRHKKQNDEYFKEIYKSSISKATKIETCDKVLQAKKNFGYCRDEVYDLQILLTMKCSDIDLDNLLSLRERNFYPSL